MPRSKTHTPIEIDPEDVPLAERSVEHVQGHWLLARLGKRVLRPGGLGLTKKLLRDAQITGRRIVEFAPGVGRTASLVLSHDPANYIGVDSDPKAAKVIDRLVSAKGRAIAAKADASGLPDGSADIVLAEGILTIQSEKDKASIVREAARLLCPGGRYVMHELSLKDGSAQIIAEIRNALAHAMRVSARPKTIEEWSQLLTEAGLEVQTVHTAKLALLEPQRIVADEGFVGAARFIRNVARDRAARKRVLKMAKTMRRQKSHLQAVGIVAVKPASPKPQGSTSSQAATDN